MDHTKAYMQPVTTIVLTSQETSILAADSIKTEDERGPQGGKEFDDFSDKSRWGNLWDE